MRDPVRFVRVNQLFLKVTGAEVHRTQFLFLFLIHSQLLVGRIQPTTVGGKQGLSSKIVCVSYKKKLLIQQCFFTIVTRVLEDSHLLTVFLILFFYFCFLIHLLNKVLVGLRWKRVILIVDNLSLWK